MAKLKLELHGFWHAGSGRGKGPGADSLVVKTSAGLPYLPGRTLKGLLRDAVRLAESAGRFPAGRTVEIFGERGGGNDEAGGKGLGRFSIRAGLLRFSDARLGEDREAQQRWEDWAASETGKEIAAGLYDHLSSTALEDGLARERSLRTVEVAVPVTLTANVQPVDDQRAGDWQGDLKAALPLLRAIGSKRSRGLGRCTATLIREEGR